MSIALIFVEVQNELAQGGGPRLSGEQLSLLTYKFRLGRQTRRDTAQGGEQRVAFRFTDGSRLSVRADGSVVRAQESN